MDRWQIPSDNRYARNAGVSIHYKKNNKKLVGYVATHQNYCYQPEIFIKKVQISENLPQFKNGS